jgi:hypothetical protein
MRASEVKRYSDHFQETLNVRRSTGDRSAVAESLAKYQSLTSWPNSEQALPPDLQRAVHRRKWLNLEVRACWFFLVMFFLGLCLSLFGGPFLFSRQHSLIPDFPAKAPLLTGALAAIFFVMFWSFLALLSRISQSHAHLEALHFMYLYDVLPRTEGAQEAGREPVFEVRVAGRVYTVFANGETDVQDENASPVD